MSCLNELERKKKKSKDKCNLKEAATCCNLLAVELDSIGKWEQAITQYKEQLSLLEALNDKVGAGIAHRRIGEILSKKNKFVRALWHHEKHLELSTEAENVVEIQRALAVISQVYVKKCDFVTASERIIAAEVAVDACQKAYEAIKNIGGQIDSKEHAQMRARALLNQGIALDIKDEPSKAVIMLYKALEFCKNYQLSDDAYRVYSELTKVHMRKGRLKEALEEAISSLQMAEKIGNKSDQIESLSLIFNIHLSSENYESAKKYLLISYRMQRSKNKKIFKSLVPHNIEFLLKKTGKICKIRTNLNMDNISAEEKLSCYEDLGDLCFDLGQHELSVRYYEKILPLATDLQKSLSYVAKIYESLGETCKEKEDYQNSVSYFEKELEIRKKLNDKQETIKTLIEINALYITIHKSYKVEYLKEAFILAENLNSPKLQAIVLHRHINSKFIPSDEKSRLEAKYFEIIEENHFIEPVELSDVENGLDSGDDVESSNYLDSSDSNDENPSGCSRKRNLISKHKPNKHGETPLHEACVLGKISTVEQLIAMKHPVNTRDNHGWTPLHEACNYGNVELAGILIAAGANVNAVAGEERITPLHDSANNGHINVMLLLINKGASVFSKNKNKDTPLDTLFRHVQNNEMNSEEIDEFIEMVRIIVDKKKESGAFSPSQIERNLLAADNRLRERALNDIKNANKANIHVGDSNEPYYVEPTETATDSYVNVMKSVGSKTKLPLGIQRNKRQKLKESLIPEEACAVDDWLIDDLECNDKKRKRSPSFECGRIDRGGERRKKKHIRRDDLLERISGDLRNNSSFDHSHLSRNISERDGGSNTKKQSWEGQNHNASIDLLSCSDDEFPEIHSSIRSNLVDNDKEDYSSPVVLQSHPFRLYVNIFHGDKSKGRFLIPVPPDCKCKTISWLENEASTRYFVSEGVKAVIALTIDDDTKLNSSDEICTVLSDEMCLKGTVVSRELPNLRNRYTDVCNRLKRSCRRDVVAELEKPNSNVSIHFNRCFIRHDVDVSCVIKSVQHQNLYSLDFSGCKINTDNVNLLLESLSYLPELQKLMLNACYLNTDMCSLLICHLSSSSQCKLKFLDLSYNNLSEFNLEHFEKIFRIPSLRDILLKSCNIFISGGSSRIHASDSFIETLYLDDNTIAPISLIDLLRPLKCLKTISLSGCLVNNPIDNANFLVSLFHTKEFTSLESIDLSCCNLTDQHVSVILSNILYFKNLQCLNLNFNIQIFRSADQIFRKLSEYCQLPVQEVHLAGVKDPGIDLMFSIQECIRTKIANVSLQKISFPDTGNSNLVIDLWKNVYDNKACVKKISSDIFLSVL